VSDPSVIPVRCPHCGASFDLDPRQETMEAVPRPAGEPDPGGSMAFRPECPSCQQRVVVQA
jgi:hypothetical protein